MNNNSFDREYKIDSNSDERKLFRVEYLSYTDEYAREELLPHCELFFVLSGNLFISYDRFLDCQVEAGKAFLLPTGCCFKMQIEKGTSLMLFRFEEIITFCGRASLRDLLCNSSNPVSDLYLLEVKPPIKSYLFFLKDILDKGGLTDHYFEIKTEELFHLLRGYYSNEELSLFLEPLVSEDVSFSNFVLTNYRKVKTVKEFSSLYTTSLSSFERKFKQVFGISPYQWMKDKKVQLVYHELNATDKPIKQIAEEQNFLSLPQFNDFCKKHLGFPPGKIRKLGVLFNQE